MEPSTEYERETLWPQAAGILLCFADALERIPRRIGPGRNRKPGECDWRTAAQLRLAVKLANERCEAPVFQPILGPSFGIDT